MPVKKYQKKPMAIDAIQLTKASFGECLSFIGNDVCEANEDECCITIATLEGDMNAHCNTWILKGVKGEFYPCKPDIFPLLYKEIE